MFVAQNTITVEFLPAPQEFRSQGAGRHSRSNGSLTIKIFVNQVHKNLCIRVTAGRGNEKKCMNLIEALAGGGAATFDSVPTPTG